MYKIVRKIIKPKKASRDGEAFLLIVIIIFNAHNVYEKQNAEFS